MLPLFFSLAVASGSLAASSPTPGSIVEVGDTLVSAMMLLVGNEEKVYILDKVENNAQQINGHPAWAAEWDIATNKATLMDMTTNVFCAAGMHMPNGTWSTFGGNNAVGPSCPTNGAQCPNDPTYGDDDGATAVRLLTPCTDSSCVWNDHLPMALQKRRWYPGVEALADGSSVLLGGFTNGGYINRNTPNTDPRLEGGAAEPTFEFWPPRGGDLQDLDFLIRTSGLNSYAHAYLMPSGKMFVQANLSTIMWDYNTNTETPLPDMPNGVVRVYPGSGGVAMLPLTPENQYTPTILFCGGSNMSDEEWGNYSAPVANTFDLPSSNDCQRITPEPASSSETVAYEQDDDMIDPRTMGQFIILPDETLLMVNGGAKGTAGYSDHTGSITNLGDMPYGMSLASAPTLQPAIYNGSAPKGSRWSNAGLGTSTIPRLYHSSAILLPDASVLIAGSNPNVDVNLTTVYPTTYKAERFYPPYFSATTRPQPSGIPTTLSYGGSPFDITLKSDSYTGDANTAAAATKVIVIRPGFSTHAMNMGQKALRLNSTYTVGDDGTITVHTSQMPNNPNLFQPGPAFVYVVIAGIPSTGKMVIIGSGNIEEQPTQDVVALPASVTSSKAPSSSGSSDSGKDTNGALAPRGSLSLTSVFSISILTVLYSLLSS